MKNFEFDALTEAKNYRKTVVDEFWPVLHGKVVEIGAGIGQMTDCLVQLRRLEYTLAVEPNRELCAQHRKHFPRHHVFEGTAADLPPNGTWDAVVCINVLEHIAEDESELKRYAGLLKPGTGHLCLFVPARREIYAPIDADFGHFRRYTAGELSGKLVRSGFKIRSLYYFNLCGYFLWWISFTFLKRRSFSRTLVRVFDRTVVPVQHFFESHLIRPPIGQSLIAIARA